MDFGGLAASFGNRVLRSIRATALRAFARKASRTSGEEEGMMVGILRCPMPAAGEVKSDFAD